VEATAAGTFAMIDITGFKSRSMKTYNIIIFSELEKVLVREPHSGEQVS
jgi:hypothetical protein